MPKLNSDQDARRGAIRDLLGRGPVPTQQSLVAELAGRGFMATQSSVSRDLREIGAVKTARGYELDIDDASMKRIAGSCRKACSRGHCRGPGSAPTGRGC